MKIGRVISVIMIIFLLGIVSFLIKPALLGYNILNQFKGLGLSPLEFIKGLDLVKQKLLIAEIKLDICVSENKDLLLDITSEKNASFKCLQEQNSLNAKLNQAKSEYEFNISIIKKDYEQRGIEIEIELSQNEFLLNKTISDHNALAENSANNICCKLRVDDKRIDSYVLLNNMVVCMPEEENKINCS